MALLKERLLVYKAAAVADGQLSHPCWIVNQWFLARYFFFCLFLFCSRPSFWSARLSFVLCSFGCALYAALGSLMKQTFNGNVNEYNGCVSLRYNSLFISLPLSTKGHKTTT